MSPIRAVVPKLPMSLQWRLFLLVLIFATLTVCNGDAPSEEKAPAETNAEDSGENIQEKLTRNVNEVYDILTNEEAPITALQNRYKGAAMRAGQGFVVGALAGKIISSLALSVFKTVVFGGIMFAVAVTCGVGADYDRLNDVYASGQIVANRMMRYFDINKDGKYDLQDVKEVLLRAEKVLLKYNFSRSFGGIIGMILGLTF